MKLGVVFIANPQSGGLYQYALTMLDSLKTRSDKPVIFNLSDAHFPEEQYKGYFKISNALKLVSFLRKPFLYIYTRRKAGEKVGETVYIEKTAKISKNPVAKSIPGLLSRTNLFLLSLLLKMNRIDLVIFTAPSDLSFKFMIPYIMPVHDLQHRLNPQFPEVSADGIWEERECIYSNAIPKAEAILVDSPIGKEDVLNYYSVDEKKVMVLPYAPPNYLRGDYSETNLARIRDKHHLPPRFLFYPANFWTHKNHEVIIKALNQIKMKHGLEIPVVFVGSRQVRHGVFGKVQELIDIYGLQDQIFYLGYVSNEDMGCLYKLAVALVMPTFFGPTNIPYLEAFALGCPVIGSDIRGVREQIGNAGLLVDPTSPEALATVILKLWYDASLRESLIKRGYDKIKSWNFEGFSETLNNIIDEIEAKFADRA